MVPIIFGILGVAACAFLTYVFVQFRHELLNVRRNPGDTVLTAAEIYRMEAAWKLASMSPHAGRRQPKKAA
jgi:hypothetical protein